MMKVNSPLAEQAERIYHIAECLIALAWVNPPLVQAKRQWLHDRIKQLGFLTATQRDDLIRKIDSPRALETVWPLVSNPQDRGYVLGVAVELFYLDGEYTRAEKEVYQKLYQSHIAPVDEAVLEGEIEAMAREVNRWFNLKDQPGSGALHQHFT